MHAGATVQVPSSPGDVATIFPQIIADKAGKLTRTSECTNAGTASQQLKCFTKAEWLVMADHSWTFVQIEATSMGSRLRGSDDRSFPGRPRTQAQTQRLSR